jgi:glycosyltransferase involved in cell wall biosynthesis
MKVLFMPINIASMQAITAEAVNNIEGVEAKCLSVGKHKYLTPTKNTVEIEIVGRRTPLKYLRENFKKLYYFVKYILWADVIHYCWDTPFTSSFDIRLIKWLKKPGVIEWVGSDIRCPEKSFPINQFLPSIFYAGYEYADIESNEKSYKLQEKFQAINFVPALAPEIQLYVYRELFPKVFTLFQRISVKKYVPRYPDVNNKRPLVIHSPSAKIAKGSNHIVSAINELKKNFDFDFVLLHDLPRSEVLRIMERADIFIDAIILGGYGMAAMEAMSFGKPTLCYLMPAVLQNGIPNDCPIVNTSPENLRENIEMLLKDPALRHELGVKGRAYVEKYHDADTLADYLVNIYRDVLSNAKSSSKRITENPISVS